MVTTTQNDGPDPPANFTMSDYWLRVAAWKEWRVPVWMKKQPPRCSPESSLHTQSPGGPREADNGRSGVPYKAWVLAGSSWTFYYCLQGPGSESGPVLLQMSLNLHTKPPPEEPSCLHSTASIWPTEPFSQVLHEFFNVISRTFVPITFWFLHLDSIAFLNGIIYL